MNNAILGAIQYMLLLYLGDPRFVFLNPQHPFHPYYVEKYTLYKSLLEAQRIAIKAAQESAKSLPTTTSQVLTVQDVRSKKMDRRNERASEKCRKNVTTG